MVEDVDANAIGAVRVTMQWFQLLLAWFSQIRWRSLCMHAQLIKLHTEHTCLQINPCIYVCAWILFRALGREKHGNISGE
jgi:hypothetical protein